MKNVKTVLIDGDEISYRSACACEQPLKWDADTWTIHSSEQDMFQLLESEIKRAMAETNTDNYQIAVSSPTNFRKEIDPKYKAHRKATRKPLGLASCRQYLIDKHLGAWMNDVEADDVIGIWSDPEVNIIWAIDKDFLTIPSQLLRPSGYLRISEENADSNLRLQTMIGDKADGFEGVIGFGPVTALKWIQKHGDTWQSVLDAFLSKGLTEEDCTRTARLARILRNYDEKYNWQPTY